MINLAKVTSSVLLLIALSACGGGGGGGNDPTNVPTDTSLVFNLFPPGLFGGSYSGSASLTGSFSNGDNVTATINSQSGSTTVFNAQPVIALDSQVTITNTSTNAVGTSSVEGYYSTDLNNLTAVGSYNSTDGVSSMATSATVIPLTASIGNFGDIGTYTSSDGTSHSSTWILQDGFNGKAKFTKTHVYYDSSNVLEFTEIDSSIISQDGTASDVDIFITFHQLGLTLTMSGS